MIVVRFIVVSTTPQLVEIQNYISDYFDLNLHKYEVIALLGIKHNKSPLSKNSEGLELRRRNVSSIHDVQNVILNKCFTYSQFHGFLLGIKVPNALRPEDLLYLPME